MDRQFQDKLYQFSAPPPADLWEKIINSLDAEKDYVNRLSQFEETPPAAAWQHIEKKLDNTSPGRIITSTHQFRKPIRFAAVAAFLVAVLVTVMLVVGNPKEDATNTASNNTDLTSTSLVPDSDKSNDKTSNLPTTNAPTGEATDPINLEEDRVINAASAEDEKRKNRPVYSSLNEYVFFNDGDGQLRKVSKKLADFVTCKDNDVACKQRLKKLRQQMAAKAMTTDFTGVVELLRQMQ